MRRWLRYLRLGLTTACGIFCLLLIASWIWSYYREPAPFDLWSSPSTVMPSYQYRLNSADGNLIFNYQTIYPGTYIPPDWGYTEYWCGSSSAVSAPYWFLIVIGSATALLSWIPRTVNFSASFSLRALLIATTLIGLILGLVVALTAR